MGCTLRPARRTHCEGVLAGVRKMSFQPESTRLRDATAVLTKLGERQHGPSRTGGVLLLVKTKLRQLYTLRE